MSDPTSSYKQIVKTTSILGSVQLFSILISVVRTKLLAVFIGPSGMGIVGLLNASINLVTGLTGLGIETSAVKNIASSCENGESNSVEHQIRIVYKLMFFTGLLGTVVLLCAASWLSQLTFGNKDYTWAFMYLAIIALFKQLTASRLVALQGLRKMKGLAKANFYGSLFGLLLTIPLYYYYRIEAIVPSMILIAICSLIAAFYFSKEIKVENRKINAKVYLEESKSVIKLGIVLTCSSILISVSSYLLQILIEKISGTHEVGLYNAGFTLLHSYVGVIFSVMSIDYYPRLSAIANDEVKMKVCINEQVYLSILLISPIVVLFLTFLTIIIKMLYTVEFIDIIPMLRFAILGMFLKMVSWLLSYVLLVKGDSKLFLKTEIIGVLVSLLLNVLGYYLGGLQGLGIAFLVYYLFYFLLIKYFIAKHFQYVFSNEVKAIFWQSLSLCIVAFLVEFFVEGWLKQIGLLIISVSTLFYSYYLINKKVNLSSMIKSKWFKK